MPTYKVTGKRQQTVTHVFVVASDDPAYAVAQFKVRYPGVTGIKAVRKSDVTVLDGQVTELPVAEKRKRK